MNTQTRLPLVVHFFTTLLAPMLPAGAEYLAAIELADREAKRAPCRVPANLKFLG